MIDTKYIRGKQSKLAMEAAGSGNQKDNMKDSKSSRLSISPMGRRDKKMPETQRNYDHSRFSHLRQNDLKVGRPLRNEENETVSGQALTLVNIKKGSTTTRSVSVHKLSKRRENLIMFKNLQEKLATYHVSIHILH